MFPRYGREYVPQITLQLVFSELLFFVFLLELFHVSRFITSYEHFFGLRHFFALTTFFFLNNFTTRFCTSLPGNNGEYTYALVSLLPGIYVNLLS